MFQNIIGEECEQGQEPLNEEVKQTKIITIFKQIFKVQNIIIYIMSFAMSMIGFGPSLAPFGLAIFAALCSNRIPCVIVYIITAIGTYIGFGQDIFLKYLLTTLVFVVSMLILKPKTQNEYGNQKKQLGLHVFLSVFLVQTGSLLFKSFIFYDLLSAIMLSIITYIFYKIFTSSIIVIKEFNRKKAFTIEEVVGTSLMLAIAITSLKGISIYNFSITNILSIMLVLILGWQNGVLVGATSGITIGAILGIIGNGEPIMIAAYAVSGMIGGIFNRFGKIGVIVGFIAGNAALAFVNNGSLSQIIHIREILVASLGLLLMPKEAQITIEDLFGKTRLLPTGGDRALEANKDTVFKLNSISQTISEIAEEYCGKASTIVNGEIDSEEINKNKAIFMDTLLNAVDGLEQNILYEDIIKIDNPIVEEIFKVTVEKGALTPKNLTDIFAQYNSYIIGAENEDGAIVQDIDNMVKAINEAYKISKVNFICQKKMEYKTQNMSQQLNGVSKAITSLAQDIDQKIKQDKSEIQEIQIILEQANINVKDINIQKEATGRYRIELYINNCINEKCLVEKIEKILSKALNEKIVNQNVICGIKEEKDICKQTYISKDKLNIQIGMAKATKNKSSVSGDSTIQTKLADGKYLIAISDGMGSGPVAKKSSTIATKMLERLLTAGFDKDVSINLINSSINLNSQEETYATLDIAILDLYGKTIEFIKNGACPTYIKENDNIQMVKSIALPAGILNDIDLVVYERKLKKGDLLVMCSDGVLDSQIQEDSGENWVKTFLENVQIENVQKIANMLVSESIDNNYGMAKDDITVIAIKIM